LYELVDMRLPKKCGGIIKSTIKLSSTYQNNLAPVEMLCDFVCQNQHI
jgi:hypothetical protein